MGKKPVHSLPEEVGELLLHVAKGWGVPLVVVATPHGKSGARHLEISPPASELTPCLPSKCRHLRRCVSDVAKSRSASVSGRPRLDVLPCQIGQPLTTISLPLRFPEYASGFLICTCLHQEFDTLSSVVVANTARAAEQLQLPVAKNRSAAGRRALAGSFIRIGHAAEGLIQTARDCESMERSVQETQESLSVIQEGTSALLDDPDRNETFLKMLVSVGNVKAIAHLDVYCDGKGNGWLRHRSLHVRKGRRLRRVSKHNGTTVADIRLKGVLLDHWKRRLPGHPCSFDSVASLRASRDVLARYADKLKAAMGPCKFVLIGRLGRNVAKETCDVLATCEFKPGCSLFCRDAPVDAEAETPWRKRLVAVDLLFVDSALPIDKLRLTLLLVASLFGRFGDEVLDLEEHVLLGLPSFEEPAQRHLLRYLFERYRAIKDSRKKGRAFEQYATGLLSLIPGWSFVGRNLFTPDNELDLVFPWIRLIRTANTGSSYSAQSSSWNARTIRPGSGPAQIPCENCGVS